MYDHGPKKSSPKSSAQSGAAAADRRNADRHIFTAAAEVIELTSGARFATRTTDLGPGGCFVDTLFPFPVGAKVRVTVRKGQTNFETEGLVVYSQTGLGMGIAFDSLEPHQRDALDKWLAELTGEKHAYSTAPAAVPSMADVIAAGRRTEVSPTVVRLVQLMISKGMLTEAEAASIFHDPVL
jgi:PilZ domain